MYFTSLNLQDFYIRELKLRNWERRWAIFEARRAIFEARWAPPGVYETIFAHNSMFIKRLSDDSPEGSWTDSWLPEIDMYQNYGEGYSKL